MPQRDDFSHDLAQEQAVEYLQDLYLLSVLTRKGLPPETVHKLEQHEPQHSHGQRPGIFAAFMRAVSAHNARLIDVPPRNEASAAELAPT